MSFDRPSIALGDDPLERDRRRYKRTTFHQAGDVMKQPRDEEAEQIVEQTLRQIREDAVPERMLELARKLQEALDSRNAKSKS